MAAVLEREAARTEAPAAALVLEVEGDEALRALESSPLALLAFYSASVKQQLPLMEELAERFGDRVLVAAVDIVAHPEVASRYGVRGLPTAVLLAHGRVIRELPGSQPLHLYEAAIRPRLGPGPAPRVEESTPIPADLLALYERGDELVAGRI